MSKPPKIVIPGLNRGAGIPPGFVLGRLPGTGQGPAQLLNLTSLRKVGLADRAGVTQSTSTAISTAHSETVSLKTSVSTSLSQISSSLSGAVSSTSSLSSAVSTVIVGSISTVNSRIDSLSTAVGGGGGVDDDSALSTSLSQISSSLSTEISVDLSRINSLSTAIGGGGGVDDDSGLSTSLSQVSSSLSGAISSTSSLSTAVSTVDSNQSTSISINLSKINSLSTAVGGGGGGGGGTPTIRATTITSSSASSYTLNWPAGTIAGDVVVLFGGHGFSIILPTGWQQIDNSTGSNVNGAVFAKLMSASDISTGHVVVTTNGGFDGCFALATITGSTMTGLRLPVSAVRSSSGTTSAYFGASPTDLFSTDTILMFSMTRGNIACTFTGGITSLQAVAAGSASGALGQFTGTLAALGPDESATFASSGTGYYTAVLAVR